MQKRTRFGGILPLRYDRKTTHLVDELEPFLVGLAVVLKLDGVEGHGGGGREGNSRGREEGHRLFLEERRDGKNNG